MMIGYRAQKWRRCMLMKVMQSVEQLDVCFLRPRVTVTAFERNDRRRLTPEMYAVRGLGESQDILCGEPRFWDSSAYPRHAERMGGPCAEQKPSSAPVP
jgi:hypothetical protein